MARLLLLTGWPGIGKTTVIRKLAATLSDWRLGGFYTEEMREHGIRQGFLLQAFNGEQGVIAHVDLDCQQRVGKYGVDVAAIDELVSVSLAWRPDVDAYLVDEIGRMECYSERFITLMRLLLEQDTSVVATVAQKGGGFIQEIKQHPDTELWTVTYENRDALSADVCRWLALSTDGVL